MATTSYQGLEILYTRQQIAERVAEIGAQITRDLNGEKLVMVGVLKGAAPFLADLARAVQADATFDFVATSSYGKGQRTSGAVKLIKDLEKIEPDYVGFSIPNLFVIGYGMDYAERYRNLPDICLMTPDHPE